MDGPRDNWGLTSPGEWEMAVDSRRLIPETVSDAVAIAFTSALRRAMGDPELLAIHAGEASGGERRAALVQWADELDMGRESLRMTLVGQRWVALGEVDRASMHPALGPLLTEELRVYLPLALGVLHTARQSGPESGLGRFGGEGWVPPQEGVAVRKKKPMSEPLDVLEARIRADVTALDRRMMSERRAGRAVTTSVDWAGVRRLLGAPRVNAPGEHPGMAARVRAAGVPNLADLVRDVLRDRGQLASYRIKQEVQRRALEIGGNAAVCVSGEQVDSCLARLARRGEVERVGHGLYRATDSLRGTSHQ